MTRKAQLFQEILASADILAAALVKRMNPGNDEISQRQAWSEFGRRRIDNMVGEGLLRPKRIGAARNSRVMYSRLEILAALDAERQIFDEISSL